MTSNSSGLRAGLVFLSILLAAPAFAQQAGGRGGGGLGDAGPGNGGPADGPAAIAGSPAAENPNRDPRQPPPRIRLTRETTLPPDCTQAPARPARMVMMEDVYGRTFYVAADAYGRPARDCVVR